MVLADEEEQFSLDSFGGEKQSWLGARELFSVHHHATVEKNALSVLELIGGQGVDLLPMIFCPWRFLEFGHQLVGFFCAGGQSFFGHAWSGFRMGPGMLKHGYGSSEGFQIPILFWSLRLPIELAAGIIELLKLFGGRP